MAKFLTNNLGTITEQSSVATSAGAGDATKIPHLDANGRLDPSFLPTGLGGDTKSITTSEALAAGDYVNVHNAGGARARKADASVSGKEAHGFVIAAFASGANATVYFEGANTQVTGQTAGVVFLSATVPGAGTSAAPTGTGQVVQRIGFAVAATEVNFQSNVPIVLA